MFLNAAREYQITPNIEYTNLEPMNWFLLDINLIFSVFALTHSACWSIEQQAKAKWRASMVALCCAGFPVKLLNKIVTKKATIKRWQPNESFMQADFKMPARITLAALWRAIYGHKMSTLLLFFFFACLIICKSNKKNSSNNNNKCRPFVLAQRAAKKPLLGECCWFKILALELWIALNWIELDWILLFSTMCSQCSCQLKRLSS